MTIRHMRIYIFVYQTQSITQAAQLLHMTQPAVTRAIQEIENYYGVGLFERINRRLYRTEVGQRLYAQALHMVDAFDSMEQSLRNWDAFGVIRVGATVTLGNFLLPELVMNFRKQYPEIRIQATISNGGSMQKGLFNNQFDITLVESCVGEPELHTEPLGGDRLLLVLPAGHELLSRQEITLEETVEYPMLLRENGSTARTFLDNYFAVRGLTLRPVWESVSTQAIVKAVSCGVGISFLPERLVKINLEAGDICTREIKDADFSRQHYLVWHKNKFLTGSMKNFIALCREQYSSIPV